VQFAKASDLQLPADTQVVASIDIGNFKSSTLGQRLLKLTTDTAAKEIGTDEANLLAKVTETLGFDPLTEVRTITLAVNNLEDINPDTASVVVQLGKTTGNIEGLMLALPGYSSHETNGHTVHQVSEGGKAACGVIHKDAKGDHWIVISPSEDRVMSLLGSLAADSNHSNRTESATMTVDTSLPRGVFARVTLVELPEGIIEDDEPFANVVKSLRRATVSIAEGDDVLTTTISVTTESEKRAEQIRQLVQGVSAAASLMIESVDELKNNPELREAASGVIGSIQVEQNGKEVDATFDVPMHLVIKFLREEADLPL
jgi:hypothetical protein